MKYFPRFYYESNLYFGWINSLEDLDAVFKEYEGHMTKDEILDKSFNIKGKDCKEFGTRIEHNGEKSLRRYLAQHGHGFGMNCQHCGHKLCDAQLFNEICFNCGKKP